MPAISGCVQLMHPLGDTFAIQDLEEKIAARKALIEPDGAIGKKMKIVDSFVGATSTPFYCGEKMTLADVSIFIFLGLIRSGYGLTLSLE